MSSARSPRTRARDLDRTEVCGLLDTAYADGQLDAAEHRSRTAAATAAKTLGELRDLVEDLQFDKPMPDLRERAPQRRPRRANLVGAGVVALVLVGTGFGIGRLTGPSPMSVGPDGVPVAAEGPAAAPIVLGATALHTPAGLRALIDGMRAEFGTTQVADLTVYPDYASLEMPVPDAPARAQSYTYRGGFDISSQTSREPDDPLVDLAAVDVDKILGLVAGAGQSLNVQNPTVQYLIVRDTGTGPEVAIHTTNNDTGASGYIEAKPDGTIIALRPYEPG
ncbi:uncharacterized protein DUF1707 [Pseudonocardia hierapolitana]|uniref:Uncharacterized protein DUF1707 n=1 Tax=Pseudonocardia hierapolitana TaxID=1128676 RepID=A0A561SLF1_9PSEU|nr:DUF1707 domain-containing protein [Pseudonocardia hierapolitana]TWF75690.1 uncharacterized protein DUF1707 [Pseudonocardia hierapolitana]